MEKLAVNRPAGRQCCIQKAWDGPVAANQVTGIFASASTDTDKARILAASSPHAGDWFHTPPIASVCDCPTKQCE